MNIIKHLDFFDPITTLNGPVHIIGIGAVGSCVAEQLTRLGIEEITIYDFDTVSEHNITNQIYFYDQIGMPKDKALSDILWKINPRLKINCKGKYTDQKLSGYIFLCVDNIDLRRDITTAQKYNPYIRAVFDFRMRLTDAQLYAADWTNPKQKEALLNSMAFTHEEAKDATPTNACGTTLSVNPTVRILVSYGIANFINFIRNNILHKTILFDGFSFLTDAYK